MAAVAEGVLLEPAADVVERGEPELAYVERVEHPGRVGQLVTQRGGVPAQAGPAPQW